MTADQLGGVLFDLDGLLVDSEPLWSVVEVELAAHLGGEWSEALKARIVGTRLDVSVPTILQWYGAVPTPARVEAAADWLLTRMVGLYRADLPLRPGARQLLTALTDRGVPLALVSSSYRVLVDAALETLGRDVFAVSVAGDEVAHGKPDPQAYLTAAGRLGAAPRNCVVLEDAPAGVAAAEAAGCWCVGVPSVTPLTATPSRPVLASLTEIEVDWLLTLPARLAATRSGAWVGTPG